MAAAGDRAQARLAKAYARTTYRVFAPGARPVDLHSGEASRGLDRLLARHGARDWVFVTAWNPASAALPRWRNARRQRRLLRVLRRMGCVAWPGLGIPGSAGWVAEESVLVPGMARARGLRIARQFGQSAILAGRRGKRATLVWAVRG